jgi:restriction system protein
MPTWEQFMVPALRVLADGQIRSRRELFTRVAEDVGLSDDLRAEMLNSGHPRYVNRIGWALSYLAKAEAVARPRRGQHEITDLGRSLLAQHPDGLTESHLRDSLPTAITSQLNARRLPRRRGSLTRRPVSTPSSRSSKVSPG